MTSDKITSSLTQRSARLNDAVEQALFTHVGDDTLIKYLEATDDAESHTGKCRVDNLLAAKRLVELCAAEPAISREKLVIVQYAMNAVLRRHGLAVDQRRAAIFAPFAQAA